MFTSSMPIIQRYFLQIIIKFIQKVLIAPNKTSIAIVDQNTQRKITIFLQKQYLSMSMIFVWIYYSSLLIYTSILISFFILINRRIEHCQMATKTNEHEFQAKVIIIGDSGVGKTNLLTKFCDGVFKDSYVATIGVDFKLKTITIDDARIKLQIWDTAGQERFRNITQTYYKGASGIILAYSIDSKQSFKNIGSWIKQIQSNTKQNVTKFLIGTKSDLGEEREVEEEEGKKLAEKNNMLFLQVSAKNGRNVEEVFHGLTRDIKNNRAANGSLDTSSNIKIRGTEDKKNENCAC